MFQVIQKWVVTGLYSAQSPWKVTVLFFFLKSFTLPQNMFSIDTIIKAVTLSTCRKLTWLSWLSIETTVCKPLWCLGNHLSYLTNPVCLNDAFFTNVSTVLLPYPQYLTAAMQPYPQPQLQLPQPGEAAAHSLWLYCVCSWLIIQSVSSSFLCAGSAERFSSPSSLN